MKLPEKALHLKYKELKSKYFSDADLPSGEEIEIKWSDKLTASAGKCKKKRKLIELSTHYHKKHPEEIEKVLLHEMIHLIVNGHPKEFYEWMDKIRSKGGIVHRHSKERATKPMYRYILKCENCGMTKRYQINAPSLKGIRKNPQDWYCGRCREYGTLTVKPINNSQ